MKSFLRKYSSSILAGIIGTGIFLYFIDPILQAVSRITIRFGASVNKTFVDGLYATASQLETFDYAYYWIAILFGNIAFAALYVLVEFWRRPAAEERPSRINLDSKFQAVGFSLVLFVGAAFMLSYVGMRWYQLNLMTSFKYHMRVIAPYIDEQEEEALISRWSLMNNKADYDSIYVDLNELAEGNDVTLPNNRIY